MHIMTERGWTPIVFPATQPASTYQIVSEADVFRAELAGNPLKIELAYDDVYGYVWKHKVPILHKPKTYKGEITLTPSTDARILERHAFE